MNDVINGTAFDEFVVSNSIGCNEGDEGITDDGFYYIYRGDIRIPFYRIYIDSVESSSCAKLCDILRGVPESSRVLLYLNNAGGDLLNTMQIVNAMKDCPGEIIAVADGKVISAASVIFLAADKYIVKPHAFMMCHNYSGMMIGKGNEMAAQMQFCDPFYQDFMKDHYRGFLSEEELERLIRGEDFYFSRDQIVERLQFKLQYRASIESEQIYGSQIIGGMDDGAQELVDVEDLLDEISEDEILEMATKIRKKRRDAKAKAKAKKGS